ncbi:hypothetical protein QYE76_065888 [Lolium multiflorum]|uniref:Nuclease HARBI1 n=1 Tax=Lolium multiflorum TaxID=4521 RepID=A0AAD8SAI2_LOLMU|nr:hypothetical protein QYE76_065888 [Lolium multiflorum]
MSSSDGMKGDMIGALQAEYEEAMLNLEAELRQPRRHREFIRRDRLGAHDRLYDDYFANILAVPGRSYSRRSQDGRDAIESSSGVNARFKILAVPGRSYSRRTLGLIMRACVILHNMIIDDERDTNLEDIYETIDSNVGPAIHNNAPPSLAARIQMDNEMRDSPMYTQLQHDLIEHVWANA